jgi:hypothetical protein
MLDYMLDLHDVFLNYDRRVQHYLLDPKWLLRHRLFDYDDRVSVSMLCEPLLEQLRDLVFSIIITFTVSVHIPGHRRSDNDQYLHT